MSSYPGSWMLCSHQTGTIGHPALQSFPLPFPSPPALKDESDQTCGCKSTGEEAQTTGAAGTRPCNPILSVAPVASPQLLPLSLPANHEQLLLFLLASQKAWKLRNRGKIFARYPTN